MNSIKIDISEELIEEMFRTSRKCCEFMMGTAVILEIKHSVENHLSSNLELGNHVSLQEAFLDAISSITSEEDLEDDWMNIQ